MLQDFERQRDILFKMGIPARLVSGDVFQDADPVIVLKESCHSQRSVTEGNEGNKSDMVRRRVRRSSEINDGSIRTALHRKASLQFSYRNVRCGCR